MKLAARAGNVGGQSHTVTTNQQALTIPTSVSHTPAYTPAWGVRPLRRNDYRKAADKGIALEPAMLVSQEAPTEHRKQYMVALLPSNLLQARLAPDGNTT